MTDTERARAIVREYQDYCDKRLLPYDYDALTDYIAHALRETREAAARVAEALARGRRAKLEARGFSQSVVISDERYVAFNDCAVAVRALNAAGGEGDMNEQRGMTCRICGNYSSAQVHAECVRIRELEAEVATLRSWVNSTTQGANRGHVDGEARHE